MWRALGAGPDAHCYKTPRLCDTDNLWIMLELLPGVRAFLDIDDLDEGKGAEFVITFCTRVFFQFGRFYHMVI